jgi:putative membrane protein
MSKVALAPVGKKQRSLAKGLLAGLIAGIVATAAKTMAERMFPPQSPAEAESPAPAGKLVLVGRSLTPAERSAAAQGLRWGFGATVGAVYGGVAEFYPAATAKDGASFGLALATLRHEGPLPALGMAFGRKQPTFRDRTSEMTSHVVFGVVTETVRRVVRRWL